MQGLAAHGRLAAVRPVGGGGHTVVDRGCKQDVEGGREIIGQALDDDGIASQRQMGAVLRAGAHGDEEAGIALEDEADLVRNQSLEMARRPHVLIAGCVAAVAAAEWLQHGGGAGWAWAAGAAALASAVAWGMRSPRGIAAGLATLVSVALGVVLGAGALALRRIECGWPGG